jgi:uroporphyrinogen III methyltransferase/synthase
MGKRVVVTRAAQQSGALIKALEEAGAIPVMLPLLAFAPPEDFSALDAALRRGHEFDWLLLTSQNAVNALQERCAALQISLRDVFVKAQVAAVGPSTAAAAESAELKISYVPRKHQGVALAEELGGEFAGKKVLLPRSDLASVELPKVLQRLGALVTEVVVYKTIAPGGEEAQRAQSLLSDASDAILFFSPSAVHHLGGLLGSGDFLKLAKSAVFTAIGPVTHQTLCNSGVDRIVVAADATVDATVNALSDYFSKATAGTSREGVTKR